jgi:hypothetical protein
MKNGEYNFVAFVDENILTIKEKKYIEYLNSLEGCTIIYLKHIESNDVHEETENLIKRCDFIMENINKYIIDGMYAIFEGFSFMSKSSKLYQFAGSNYYMRERLIKSGCIIQVTPPSSVKKFAGKGNAKKDDMINFFLERTDNDSPFKDYLHQYMIERKTKKLMKPLDDLVDSYFIAKSIN